MSPGVSGSLRRAYGAPATLGVLSVGGLVLALVADGAADVLALGLIALPLLLVAHSLVRPRTARTAPSTSNATRNAA